jgi:hypothetical protein
MSLLPSKTKETVFQILNRTIWTQNKAFKSGQAPDALCYRCDEIETMEHLLYCCEHYSAKIWDLAGKSLTLALSHHSGEYIPAVFLTPWKSFLTNHIHQYSFTFRMPPHGKY